MLLTSFALLLGTNQATAQYTVQDVSCPTSLNSCTANDLRVGGATATLADPGQICAGVDDEISLNLAVNYDTNATRYDIAFVIAEDGQNVADGTGECTTTAFLPGEGGFVDAEHGGVAASCGDLSQGASTNTIPEVVTISCSNVSPDGFLQFDGCTVWNQNTGGSFDDAAGCNITDTSIDSGTGSKCRCDTYVLDIPVYGVIKVEKKVVDYLGNDYPTMASFDVEVTGSPTAAQTGSVTTAAHAEFPVEAGTYSVTETDLPAGYSYVATECRDDPAGPVFGPNDVQVSFGDTVTCTIINEVDPIDVYVEKIPEGNYPTPLPNFELDVSCGGGVNYTLNTDTDGLVGSVQVNPGTTCDVSEDTVPADWEPEIVTGSVTATAGAENRLIVKNVYAPKRKVYLKKVVIDAPAGASPSFDIELTCGGEEATGTVSDGGMIELDNIAVGTDCTGSEPTVAAGYTYGGDVTQEVVASGDNIITITNAYIPTYLKLVKLVDNPNGAPKIPLPTDYVLTADGTTDYTFESGDRIQVVPGTYTLEEALKSGRDPDYGLWYDKVRTYCGDPSNTGETVTLNYGDDVTCYIENEDDLYEEPGYLYVQKDLVQNYGGTLSCSDFSYTVTNVGSFPWDNTCISERYVFDAGTTVSVTEDNPQDGYTLSYNGCSSVTIESGVSKTCIIKNEQDEPPQDLYPTRTQGYWKTHPYAASYHGSISVCGDTYSTTSKDYCSLFKQKGRKANFYRQAGAAALNCAEWGCPADVQYAVDNCQYNKAGFLDSYNNGLAGYSEHEAEQPTWHGPADPRYCK